MSEYCDTSIAGSCNHRASIFIHEISASSVDSVTDFNGFYTILLASGVDMV